MPAGAESSGDARDSSPPNTRPAQRALFLVGKTPPGIRPPAPVQIGHTSGARAASSARRRSAPAAQAPLLRTKLIAPAARRDLVPRPHLFALLDRGRDRPLTLVLAPAGSGKTTLLSAWLDVSASQDAPLAWVSLDREDNDPTRFWSYVVAALDDLHPGVGAAVLPALQSPDSPPIRVVLTALLNALAALSTDTGLILDDYHLIDCPAVHEAVTFLLDHLPPQVHLVISARAGPPLPLARLRAHDAVTEIRAADLRFRREEVVAFFGDVVKLSLPREALVALADRTEGWIAGLQLAAISLRGRSAEERLQFVDSFTGSNRYVRDYLVDEVLRELPPRTEGFLLQTAVLDRMCAPLCQAVIGEMAAEWLGADGSGADLSGPGAACQPMLEEVERENLFLVPLDDDRRWFRFHYLFAEVLRDRLRQVRPNLLPELHRRASAWFAEQGLIPEAIQHALAAADFARAARLIEEVGPSTVARGHVQTVLDWLAALPEDVVRRNALLCVIYSGALMLKGPMAEAEERLRDAERLIGASGFGDDTGPGEATVEARTVAGLVSSTRAGFLRVSGDLAGSAALGRRALELLPETEVFSRAFATLNAAYECLVSGDATAESEREVASVVSVVGATGHRLAIVRSIVLLAQLQKVQGRLRQAASTYAQVLSVAGRLEDPAVLAGSPTYYFGVADLLREWNDLEGAERLTAQGLELLEGSQWVSADSVLLGYLTLARLRQARGHIPGAIEAMAEFRQIAHERGFVRSVIARAAAVEAELAVARDDLLAAGRWADLTGLTTDDEPSFPLEREQLAFARVRIAQGRARLTVEPADELPVHRLAETVRFLDRLLSAAENKGRMGSAVEINVLKALALDAAGEATGAQAALLRALTLAELEGYARVFVDEGAPLAALLSGLDSEKLAARSALASYVRRLQAAFAVDAPRGDRREMGKDGSAGDGELAKGLSSLPDRQARAELVGPAESLTPRELEVLCLMAGGASNREIARKLVISLGTVKKHGNNIFGKLGVVSRIQAVMQAGALGLL